MKYSHDVSLVMGIQLHLTVRKLLGNVGRRVSQEMTLENFGVVPAASPYLFLADPFKFLAS